MCYNVIVYSRKDLLYGVHSYYDEMEKDNVLARICGVIARSQE